MTKRMSEEVKTGSSKAALRENDVVDLMGGRPREVFARYPKRTVGGR